METADGALVGSVLISGFRLEILELLFKDRSIQPITIPGEHAKMHLNQQPRAFSQVKSARHVGQWNYCRDKEIWQKNHITIWTL